VPDFPAHLLEVADAPSDFSNPKALPSVPPLTEIPFHSLGAIRGAIFSLPIAVVMWAIIIAAVLHFLIV